MKIKYVFCTCALLFSPWVLALDLVEAYERAKQSDPAWKAHQLQYEADQLNLGIASGNLLPTVTITGNVTRKNQGANDAGSSAGFGMPESVTSKQIALTARQPLFRWDAWEGLKQVKTSIHLSELNLRQQRQDHILKVAEAYFNVLRQQALTVANLQEEKALSEQLKMMDAKLKDIEFLPIPIFGGIFDGQGHTISGLSIKVEGSNQGLFRYLQEGAVIKDVN